MSSAVRDVSVIISTYSTERWPALQEAVRSVAGQRRPPAEIVVAVDHNPELYYRVQEELPSVVVVQNRHQRGLAGARNAGLAAARGEVVAFIDDDALAAPDWLEKLCSSYSGERVLGVGGRIEPEWQAGRPGWFPQELDWVVGCTYRGLPVTRAEVRNLIGCNMSFRRNVVVECGGFRNGIGRLDDLPLGCEETELCIRLRQRWPQHALIYEPEARVKHRVPSVRRRWSYLVHRCYAEGVSKAQVSRAVGAQDGLSSERRYVLHTLPAAFGRGLAESLRTGRLTGAKQSMAIASGLLAATAGYCHGWLKQRRYEQATDSVHSGAGELPASKFDDVPVPAQNEAPDPARLDA